MPDAVTPGDADRIARLARLALTDEERTLYARQLSSILDYARQLEAVDTTDVPPMTRADEDAALERADEPRPSLPRDAALRNAPESAAGLFVVPRVLGAD